jgi:hypothetical protein
LDSLVEHQSELERLAAEHRKLRQMVLEQTLTSGTTQSRGLFARARDVIGGQSANNTPPDDIVIGSLS